MRRVRQLTYFIVITSVFMYVNGCSLYSETDRSFLDDQARRTGGTTTGTDESQNPDLNQLKREKIIQVAQAKLSLEEFAQAEPLKKYCDITGTSFEVEKMPVTISHAGREVYVETELKDSTLFKENAAKVLGWWKRNYRVRKVEDKGLRLVTMLKIPRAAKYDDIAKAIFEFYQKNFQNVVISVICRELNSWAVNEYPNDFSVVIEKKQENQTQKPTRRGQGDKAAAKKAARAAARRAAKADARKAAKADAKEPAKPPAKKADE